MTQAGIIVVAFFAATALWWWQNPRRKAGEVSRNDKLALSGAIAGGIALLCFLAAFHIVHGGGMGWHLCKKYGWTLDDTFVDMGDLRQGDVAPKLGRALDGCLK